MTDKAFAGVNLEGDLDDIADLPAFKTPPTGGYVVNLPDGIVIKEVNEKSAAGLKMVIKEVTEVVEQVAENEMPKVGDEFEMLYMLDNEIGAGFYKEVLKALSEKVGSKKPAEINKGCKGMDVAIVLKRTFNKDKQRHFANLVQIAPV